MSQGTIRIRNWEKWQTYRRDRGQPPWIKVHRDVMRDPAWVQLTDAQRGQLVALWIIAADRDGQIPDCGKLLRKLCYMEEEPDLELFARLGFVERDANMTPTWRQHDAPEAETEAETETEEKEEEARTREPNRTPTCTGVSATTTNGVGADPTEAMLDHLAKHAATMPQDSNRRKLIAQARMVATGEDRKAWECPDGSTIPEDERPEIFRLALGYHADGTQRAFRSSVRYACKLYSEPEPDPNLANLPPADRRIAERVMQLRGLDLGSFAA